MFGRIQTVDNKVLYNISRMHKPALTKIMVASSRLGNAGFVWWRSAYRSLLYRSGEKQALTLFLPSALLTLWAKSLLNIL